ncbi:FecR family protein [Albibacterium bauzanense]|uniref:FecR family protein n=1 Tax=Albibacterium bauzanense TaxID=653929 RepID=A0A4R1LPM1_9SPHI|nr:FecR domain-containing protein [Albibacterium bauzanense]TCK80785.1 FecR family protein [Albibacterium bauzanense]
MKDSNTNETPSLTQEEKDNLKKRITHSIFSYKRKLRIKYAIAASLILFLSIGLFLHYNHSTPLQSIDNEKYTSLLQNLNADTLQNVTLVLNENQNIDIADNNSSISYSSTGEKIKIGNSQIVDDNTRVTMNTLIVPYGKRTKLQLSDGSTVWLNSGSKLAYPASFNEDKRKVYLEGEAIFEVTHDKSHPFMVIAKDFEIEVLGTVFNVSNYSDDPSINTVLKNGSVKIQYKGNSIKDQSLIIKPGTFASYSKDSRSISTATVDVDKYFSWRDGIIIFKNDNLKDIMKQLSRYYNASIEIKNKRLENQTFSGSLDLKETVEQVLNIIKETSDFEFEKTTNNQFIIN